MANLRIDGDGWLQPRSAINDLGSSGDDITGIAATPSHVFILRDGTLYIAEADDLTTETEITDVSDLSGRISVVDFTTYVVLTSEGDDQGFIIDVRDVADTLFPNEAAPLGLDAPSDTVFSLSTAANANSELDSGPYYYKIVYRSTTNQDVVWHNMQSNPSEEKQITNTENNQVEIDLTIPSDRIIEGAYIYRSRTEEGPYYRIDGLAANNGTDTPKTSTFIDIASNEDAAEAEQLKEKDNSRLPAEVKQLYKYNDRIFAPVKDRLIYSDLDFGNIVPWAYPADNDIRTGKRVDWCAEINEILLFGSREGTWRLTGGTEYDFAVGQISGQGAIDAHAWGKISSGLAFVGEAGLFVTDASQVVEISDIILDGYFRNRKAISAGVVFFKDNNILFTVTLKDADDTETDYQFKREDGYWTRWDLDFRQAASIIEDNEATLVLIADGTGQLKQLDWNSTAINDDTEWTWESHAIDMEEARLANDLKRFSMLQFTGDTENEMTLTTYKDDEITPLSAITFNSRASSLKPVRVPINRIARRLRFRLEGTGRCKIQGLRLEIIK